MLEGCPRHKAVAIQFVVLPVQQFEHLLFIEIAQWIEILTFDAGSVEDIPEFGAEDGDAQRTEYPVDGRADSV